jgi:peptidyl-Asp metalloendopeptidase
MTLKSFPKKFNIIGIFICFISLMLFTTPVFSAAEHPDFPDGIFSDVPYSEAAAFLNQVNDELSPKVIRSRLVRVDIQQITGEFGTNIGGNLANDSHKLFELNLFHDAEFITRIDKTVINRSGSTSFIGVNTGNEFSRVIFTIRDNIMVGSFVKGKQNFIIRYVGNGIHEIQEMDHSRFPGCEEPLTVNPFVTEEPESIEGVSAPLTNTTIDVMVVYTATARSGAGGTTAMETLIDQAVAESNTGYSNSEVNITLDLVHTAEVTYSETSFDWSTCLSRLSGTSDGYMDNVHTLRNTYQADVVSMIVNNSSYCGLATTIMATESQAFSLVSRTCATGYYSFAHEIGHLQGARHDRYVDNTDNSPYTYNHGRTYPAGGWRTIMAYNTACAAQGVYCTRINYWSNPNVYYNGVPTGIPGGAGVGADNHLCLNNTASTIAAFRVPLAVSLAITDVDYIGDKRVFLLRATASGGTGSYNFSWSGAYRDYYSTPTTNPNYARRTILSSQTVTVSVTVTSGTETVTKYKTLADN